MASSGRYDFNVFVNCPFDRRYEKLFKAVVFSVIDCGFVPRCALEFADSSVARLDKLFGLVNDCRLGIHDISRIQLDSKNRVPRFNMPFELGLFIGAKRFGVAKQRKKNCVILDTERYRYQKFISDLGGMDIFAHSNDTREVIRAVRNWLGNYSGELMPGAGEIFEKFSDFIKQLRRQCLELGLVPEDLTFVDYRILAEEWLMKYDDKFPVN